MFKKILTAEQTRAADAYTIANEPIRSIDLMERASLAFVEYLREELALEKHKIVILCGTGNNGGDGLAIARILLRQGFDIQAILLKHRNELSEDCGTNYEAIKEQVVVVKQLDELPNLSSYSLVIDAILGTGVNSPLRGLLADAVEAINRLDLPVYAVDLPSGLYADTLNTAGPIVEAAHVLSFQRPKLSFFLPENNRYIARWAVADIGLDEAFIQEQESSNYVLDHAVKALLQSRPRYSHKGSYGHALMLAGSEGKMGAAILCAKGCLRSGVGLLTMAVPSCGLDILQIAVPEAMAITDLKHEHLSQLPSLSAYAAVGIGPGLGQHDDTRDLLHTLFNQNTAPLVIDADALNLLAVNLEILKQLASNSILTPHIKEFDRLVGASENSMERFDKLRDFSTTHQCIVVLKDAHTAIATPDENIYFNTTGNPGMATGGSGDVLTGIITGLLAQGYAPRDAALLGVYFHGLAGDRAADIHGQMAMLASDIIDNLYLED